VSTLRFSLRVDGAVQEQKPIVGLRAAQHEVAAANRSPRLRLLPPLDAFGDGLDDAAVMIWPI
jgi:hypothetical protein